LTISKHIETTVTYCYYLLLYRTKQIFRVIYSEARNYKG